MSDNVKIISLDFVNAYLLKAKEGFVLIDTGLPYQWEMLEKELISAGCLPDKLKLVVITHGDWDHTGNVTNLREKYNVKCAMNAGDVPQVENGVMLKRSVRPLMYKIFFAFRMLKLKLNKDKMNIPKFKPDIILTDGQSLEEYGLTAKTIHIPGHTPGSMGVLTAEGDLFSGDMFVNRKKPDSAQIIENRTQLKDSLERMKKMNIKTVYPGHGRPFEMQEFLKAR